MFSVRGELRDAPWLWQKKVASIEVLGKPPWLKTATRAWRPVILSSDRFRRRFAAWLAGFFLKLALGAGPVLERISGRATALQIDMVGAQCDLLGCRTGPTCSRHPHCWRGTLPRLGHTLLPSTAAFILHWWKAIALEFIGDLIERFNTSNRRNEVRPQGRKTRGAPRLKKG